MQKVFVGFSVVLALASVSIAQENYGQWKFYRNITINTTASGADVANSVTKFPMLMRLGTADSMVFNGAQSNGADIRFSQSNGTTHVKYQIERWDAVNQQAEIWILVDTVYGNDSAHSFRMYWGKNGAADSSNGGAVFDTANGYAGVWHFNGTNFNDATANHNDGIDNGSKDTIGVIGGAKAFHGDLNNPMYVAVADAPSLNFTNGITMSAWIRPSAWATNNRIMQKNGTSNADDQYRFWSSSAANMQMTLPGTSGTAPTTAVPSTGAWHLVHATWDGSAIMLYKDGALAVTSGSVTGSLSQGSGEFNIGRKPLAAAASDYGNMAIDEPRLSSVARSVDWIKLEYATQQIGAAVLSSGPRLILPPSNLSYTLNPATYTVGYAITPNVPTLGGGIATSYSVNPSLPAGLTLDTLTGIISGTPTAAAVAANYTVTARNGLGSTTVPVNFTVNATLVAPTGLSYSRNPVIYFSGAAITSNNPSVTGTVTGYSVAPALPAGLTLNTSTGVITGTPTVGSASTGYVVTASNPAGSTSVTLTITVTSAPSNLSYSTNPATYYMGTTITPNTPTVTGAVTSYSVNPALPEGLTLNATTGIIAGTPTVFVWPTDFVITAANPAGFTSNTINISVNFPVGIASQSASSLKIMVSGSSSISFCLPRGVEFGKLSILDVFGRIVWTHSIVPNGPIELTWNGRSGARSVAPGIYLVRLAVYNGHKSNIFAESKITLTP
jgi:hypothetical protein